MNKQINFNKLNKIKIPNYLNNYLVKNTIILILTSLLIKLLSLVNRIVITRLLGPEGISLYVLILPTIMLFCSISCFSLNITMSKMVAENEKEKNYTHKQLIISGIKIGSISTIVTLIFFSIFINFISINLLKQKDSFLPLLCSFIMFPLTMFNSVYKGFFNGLDKIEISSKSSLFEQLSRIFFSFSLLILFKNNSTTILVSISIIAMSFGELISLLYNANKYKVISKLYRGYNKVNNNIKNSNIKKNMFEMSLSQTLSHLISNVSFFLEPIIYTYALGLININPDEAMYRYSEVNAYALPLLTMFMFTSSSIGTVIIPILSKNNYNHKAKEISKISLILSLLPAVFLSVVLFFFGDKYMYLLYKSTIGSTFVKKYSILFGIFYIQPILNSILQAHGKQKKLFSFTVIASICKLLTLFTLTFIKSISHQSLFFSIIVGNLLHTTILLIYVIKLLKLKFNYKNIIKLILIFIITFYTFYIFHNLNINYIVSSFIGLIFFFIYLKISNFLSLIKNIY